MSAPTKKLFLLDAMALIYRAHFAFSKSPRINSKGVNTGATLGFTSALVEVINKERPTHLIVAFDTGTPTWRHKLFKAYKEHRQAQPEDITTAIPYIKSILKAFRIPVLESDGYEADDIIGTLACQAAQQSFEVYMMTPDKDFAQLVDEHIYLYRPAFMGNSAAVLGTQEILAKWGVERVDQVRDILALQGDSVDNIPGIPTIGAKTAKKLIQQFGSVENLVTNADQLAGKLREQVVTYSQQGILSKELATIHTDVLLQFDLEQSRYQGPDPVQLKPIFQELEFRSLTRKILGEDLKSIKAAPSTQASLFGPPDKPCSSEAQVAQTPTLPLANTYTTRHQYHLIDTPALRKSLISYLELQDTFCLDTETTSLDPHQASLIGIAFAYYPGEAYYVPIPADYIQAQAIVGEFKELFESPTICKVGQNLKYDSRILRRYGVAVSQPTFDTMLAHYLLAPDRPHNINAMAETYLHYTPLAIESLIGRKGTTQKNMKDIDLALVKEYACEDADIALQLKQQLEPAIAKEQLTKLLYEIELPIMHVLTNMEHQGVQVDTNVLQEIATTLAAELQALEQEIYVLAGYSFNISSPKQLGELLFGQLKLAEKPQKTKSGQYATGELVLAAFAKDHKIVAKILEYRELQKLKSTYVDALPRLLSPTDGKIHTSYNQTVVTTGRLSSTNPNLQNIPIRTEKGRAIRRAFVPSSPDHVLLAADYSQIELRIIASFAQDETMIEAFKKGKDIHSATASKLFQVPIEAVDDAQRRQAKTANFGIIYGISAFGLSQRLGIPKTEATAIIEAYFQKFPAIKAYIDRTIHQARKQGYVTTLMGRKKYLRDINSRNATTRGFDERNAINAPIQGTAAEMIKLAMIRIHAWLQQAKLQSKLIMQVHDELVFDVPTTEVAHLQEQIPWHMKNALPLEVPVEVVVGIGKNWLEAH
ncbi:MAG: DNA polymerase I [Bacteroidota bacterium]